MDGAEVGATPAPGSTRRRHLSASPPAGVSPMGRAARRAAIAGVLVSGLLFGWLLLAGRAELASPRFTADFYDLQARSMLDGRLDVPFERFNIEAIADPGCSDIHPDPTDCRYHTYFGPAPSLLRLPVLALTDRFDGRLTQPSMLLAFGVLGWAAARLAWSVRWLTRAGPRAGQAHTDPLEPDRVECVLLGVWCAAVGGATVVLYLAGQVVVYHEAILWGVALATAAFDSLIRFLVAPGGRRLVGVSAWAGAAFLTRASVGLGPMVALAVVTAVGLLVRFRPRRWTARHARWWLGERWSDTARRTGGVVGAAAVPAVLYVAVNLLKFGTPFQLPLDRQVFTDVDGNRQAALAANGGSIFGLRYLPTTLLQYLRPDALSFTSTVPYVDFPTGQATVVGGATFDTLDRASSVTSTMPWLAVLSGIGAVVGLAPGRRSPSARRRAPGLLAPVRAPVAGAAAGAALSLGIGFVAHRYVGDALPLMLILGPVGMWWALDRYRRSAHDVVQTTRRWALVGAAVLLVVWGAWVNLSLGLTQQRLHSPASPVHRADFVAAQLSWPGSDDTLAEHDSTAPAPGPRGTLLVVGYCEGVYWSDGTRWHLLEASERGGGHTRVLVDDSVLRQVKVSGSVTVAGPVELVDGTDGPALRVGAQSAPLFPRSSGDRDGEAVVLDVLADRANRTVLVLDGEQVLLSVDGDQVDQLNEAATTDLPTREVPTPLCDRLAPGSGGG